MFFDRSLKAANNLCCGANSPGAHYTGLDMERDIAPTEWPDLAKAVENGICPQCGRPMLIISRGIEVGNIFQLGDKYTRSMGMTYLDREGQSTYPVMGCYGIGVGRLAASVCEARRDAHGPVWPMSIAPWQVHLCAVRASDARVREAADGLYRALQSAGAEVIYDDRPVSAGVMFADADLLGAPLRVTVSPRNMAEGCCEITARDGSACFRVSLERAVETVLDEIAARK